MKLKLFGAALAVAAVAVLGSYSAHAMWPENLQGSNGNITVARGETRDGSVYLAGDKVTIDGTVNGDVYCAGATVVISGTVNGDVMCAGQSIDITGNVSQDVRLAAQNITITSAVKGNASLFAQNARVEKSASIGGDLNGASQTLTLDGTVSKNAVLAAQALNLKGTIAGDANLAVQSLATAQGAKISGNLYYTSDSELTVDKGVVVGSTEFNPTENSNRNKNNSYLGVALFVVLSLFVTSMLVAVAFPRFLQRADARSHSQKLNTAIYGFTFVFATPIIAVMAFATVVLIPLGLALMLAWMLVLTASGIVFAYIVGSSLLRSSENVLVRMAGGAALVLLLYLVPFINVIALFVAGVYGSGAVITTLFHNYQRPSYTVGAVAKSHKK